VLARETVLAMLSLTPISRAHLPDLTHLHARTVQLYYLPLVIVVGRRVSSFFISSSSYFCLGPRGLFVSTVPCRLLCRSASYRELQAAVADDVRLNASTRASLRRCARTWQFH